MITSRMIGVAALAFGLSASAAPPSGPLRSSIDVTASPAAAGTDGLGYFVPEVARSLADALPKGGVSTTAASGSPADVIAVRLDEKPGDRVVISARVRGQKLEVEGTVEAIDALVEDLVFRMLPLLGEAPATNHAARPASRPQEQSRPVTKAASVVAPVTPSPAIATPATVPSPAVLPVLAPPPPELVAPAKEALVPDPYGSDARVSEVSAQLAPAPAFVRGRVVVHTITDPAGGEPGSGSIATQAIYAVLQRRLRVSIVPLGAGMTSLAVAAEEGLRAQARFVIMARVDSYVPLISGLVGEPAGARLRLEISLVRDGHLVMRRILLAEAPPSMVVSALTEGRRGRAAHAVYLAVARALDQVADEIALSMTSPMSDGR